MSQIGYIKINTNKPLFFLNLTGFVLNTPRYFLITTEFFQNMTGLVSYLTGMVLNITGCDDNDELNEIAHKIVCNVLFFRQVFTEL